MRLNLCGFGSAGSAAYLRSVDDEGLHVRIILKNSVIARSDSCGIFDGTAQLKADIVSALSANWEPLVLEQSSLVHQAVRIVSNPVNSAFRHHVSWPIFLSHDGSSDGFDLAASESL